MCCRHYIAFNDITSCTTPEAICNYDTGRPLDLAFTCLQWRISGGGGGGMSTLMPSYSWICIKCQSHGKCLCRMLESKRRTKHNIVLNHIPRQQRMCYNDGRSHVGVSKLTPWDTWNTARCLSLGTRSWCRRCHYV